ncbi:MAG TPA: hypothetical protein DIT97_29475 [Gimesia maris]|jgi:hypothetical protein|uniref:Uncharacterized protein n=1 Tax=Gimesia maris TaxID=122 RepID=A0A3D3RFX7_9PLAN|nr:hypothetical protein [Gimesia maris]|tara:strand:+ start:7527 stop:7739 length:213 start_codon:yes stop_codon:yes gene_type:complete
MFCFLPDKTAYRHHLSDQISLFDREVDLEIANASNTNGKERTAPNLLNSFTENMKYDHPFHFGISSALPV